jgi:diadenylate cyclase
MLNEKDGFPFDSRPVLHPLPRPCDDNPHEPRVMKTVSRNVVQHAHSLACEIEARAVLIYADAIAGDDELRHLLGTVNYRTILIARPNEIPLRSYCGDYTWVEVTDVHMTRLGQVKMALLSCLAKGVLQARDRVVCLTGIDGSSTIDTLMVLDLGTEPELFSMSGGFALGGDIRFDVFERAVSLATQLAVQGREGRPVGLIMVLGDSENVQAQSRNLVLNPFRGYSEAERNILDAALEETIKEFSALDGAFIIRGDGVVVTAGAHLIPTTQSAPLANGLGTRHAAAAAITASTHAVAIVVSQSTGTMAVFMNGQMVTDVRKPINGRRLAI